jgi:thiol-disulfide isomerase/thioredoxin
MTLALACLLFVPTATAADREVGDTAPSLSDVEWLQGKPVPSFGDGRVYVLDFWATWCGPCIRSIPHINAMANELRDDITVIGVAIWPRETMTPTDEYVQKRGDEMAYTIAEDIDGQTAKSFMEAAGRNGIPTAMVIDGAGILTWMGHPQDGMDEVVRGILDGSFDRVAWAEAKAIEMAAAEALKDAATPLQKAFQSAMKEDRFAEAAASAQELVTLDDSLAYYVIYAYQALNKDGRQDEAVSYALDATRGPLGQDASALNWLSWDIVAPEREAEPTAAELDLALVAATKANELGKHADPSVLDTLARVHWRRGNMLMAAMLQQRAVDMAPEEMRQQLKKVLDEYQSDLTTG